MRKILSLLLAAATLACTTPDLSGQPVYSGNSEISAPITASVTVPITVFSPTPFPALSPPTPPSWGFYGETNGGDGGNSIGYNDYYIPISVPVGSTITQVKARVASGLFNGCQLFVWRQPDFQTIDYTALGTSNTIGSNTVGTLTAALNTPTQELVQYFVTVHPTSAVSNVRCSIPAAQVTYTPGA